MYDNITPHTVPRYDVGDVSRAVANGTDLAELREIVWAARYSVRRTDLLDALGVDTAEEMWDMLFPFHDSPAHAAVVANPSEANLAGAISAGWTLEEVAAAVDRDPVRLADTLAATATEPADLPPRPKPWPWPNLNHVPQYIFVDSTSTMPTTGLPEKDLARLRELAAAADSAEERVRELTGKTSIVLRRNEETDTEAYTEVAAAHAELVAFAHRLADEFGMSAEQMTAAVGKEGNRYWLRRLGQAEGRPF